MIGRYILIIICIQFGCSKKISEIDQLNKKNPIGFYGEELSDGIIYKVEEILMSPESKIGEKIIISGFISDVCPMRGCWLQVNDNDTKESIRVKVTDGEIVFPLSAKGNNVIVEGEFIKLELSDKQAKIWKKHLAVEKGIELDTSKIILNENDYYEYRLNSNSAKIF